MRKLEYDIDLNIDIFPLYKKTTVSSDIEDGLLYTYHKIWQQITYLWQPLSFIFNGLCWREVLQRPKYFLDLILSAILLSEISKTLNPLQSFQSILKIQLIKNVQLVCNFRNNLLNRDTATISQFNGKILYAIILNLYPNSRGFNVELVFIIML